jgi:hypothetical protein
MSCSTRTIRSFQIDRIRNLDTRIRQLLGPVVPKYTVAILPVTIKSGLLFLGTAELLVTLQSIIVLVVPTKLKNSKEYIILPRALLYFISEMGISIWSLVR